MGRYSNSTCCCPVCGRLHMEVGIPDGSTLPCSAACEAMWEGQLKLIDEINFQLAGLPQLQEHFVNLEKVITETQTLLTCLKKVRQEIARGEP